MRIKLRPIYKKKRRLLEEVEVISRTSLAHTYQEIVLGKVANDRIRLLESALDEVENKLDSYQRMEGNPDIQKYVVKRISEKMGMVRILQKEIDDTFKRLVSHKKNSSEDVRKMRQRFRKFSSLRSKMDKVIDKHQEQP